MNGTLVGTIACSTDILVVRSWQSAADLLLPGDTALDWTSWKAKADLSDTRSSPVHHFKSSWSCSHSSHSCATSFAQTSTSSLCKLTVPCLGPSATYKFCAQCYWHYICAAQNAEEFKAYGSILRA